MTEIRIQVAEEVDRYLDAAVRNGLFTNKAEIARAALIQYMNSINLMSRNYDDELVFSPEGRLYQIEYARNAVSRGLTSVAMACSDGVVICCEKMHAEKTWMFKDGIRKIFELGENIILTYSGMIVDGNLVTDSLRNKSFKNNTQLMDAIKQTYKPYLYERNTRPLGVGFLIGSTLDKPVVLYVDPSGSIVECNVMAMGHGADDAMKILEKNYKKMTVSKAEEFAVESLGEVANDRDNYELKTLNAGDSK